MASLEFGRMLSVGTIDYEDRFCTSRKGGIGGSITLPDTAWWRLQLPVENNDGWPFVYFLAQTGVENTPFTLEGLHFWQFRQLLVQRSVLWSEGPDYWMLANEWVCPRSWTHGEYVNKALTQVSSASSKQKWKYGPYGRSTVVRELTTLELSFSYSVSVWVL